MRIKSGFGAITLAAIALVASVRPSIAQSKLPIYGATDYDRPTHPAMTDRDIAKIRRVLARVKPCQRQLVRYILPDGPGSVALFFAVPPHAVTHIFGTRTDFFWPSESSFWPPLSPDAPQRSEFNASIQSDINHEACNA